MRLIAAFLAVSFTAYAGSVTLAWDSSTDPSVVGYNVYYGCKSGVYTNRVSCGSTSATISNLTQGVTYYFAATCRYASVESAYSQELSVVIPTYPLTRPGQLGEKVSSYTPHIYTNRLTGKRGTNQIPTSITLTSGTAGLTWWTLQATTNLPPAWWIYSNGYGPLSVTIWLSNAPPRRFYQLLY